jgi:hypothetical protein
MNGIAVSAYLTIFLLGYGMAERILAGHLHPAASY